MSDFIANKVLRHRDGCKGLMRVTYYVAPLQKTPLPDNRWKVVLPRVPSRNTGP